MIHNTNLAYTILQPGSLVETPETGAVSLQVTEPGKNSIGDVAEVLASLLEYPNTTDKVITMHEGQTPIATALADI